MEAAAALKGLGRWLAVKRKEIRRQVRVQKGRREGEERTSIEIEIADSRQMELMEELGFRKARLVPFGEHWDVTEVEVLGESAPVGPISFNVYLYEDGNFGPGRELFAERAIAPR